MLRSALSKTYCAGATTIVHHLIGASAAPRNFERVVILAPLARRNGIASGARLQWQALQQLGIECHLLDAAPGLRNPFFRIRHDAGSAYIVHAGGPQSACLLWTALPHAASALRIAYWAWELPDPPANWQGADRNFDEIWTPSSFSRDSLAKLFRRPIHVVPHYLPAQARHRRDPDRPFTVLVMADSRSSLTRKNPKGAIDAFRLAFGTSPSARLILKLGGKPGALNSFEQTVGASLRAPNIQVIRGHLTNKALTALYSKSDVLLSLHRAEGFGLPMAEAMSHGLPVVATAWSGNMDFMNQSNSEPVPYRLVPVVDDAGIYSESVWAEPDLDHAAEALRRLAENREHYEALSKSAFRCQSTANQMRRMVTADGI